MPSDDTNLPYVLTGCIFYAFGVKWCCEYARMWYVPPRMHPHRPDSKLGTISQIRRSCLDIIGSHPLEGSLKLIATVIGLAGTLTGGGIPHTGVITAKVVHATIYLFFAFSGLVDVLNFYFPRNISDGFTKLALAQSFFIEGFLYLNAKVSENHTVNLILAAIVWLTSLSVCLEVIWPEAMLIRGASTLLHGAWVAHMVRVFRVESLELEKIALTFSWHVAAASSASLLVVAITRSCIPRPQLPPEPPEVPIYDYCNELDIRPS